MDLEKTPGLTDAERAAVAAYEEAHRYYAVSAVGEFFNAIMKAEHEAAGRVNHAVERMEETYSRVSELAPAKTPGREGGTKYGELLSLLQRLGVGDREVAKLGDPPILWRQLPGVAPARVLLSGLDALPVSHQRYP